MYLCFPFLVVVEGSIVPNSIFFSDTLQFVCLFYFAYDVCVCVCALAHVFGHEDACTLLHAYGGQRTSSGVGPLPTFTLRPNRLLLLPLCIHQTRRPIIKGFSSFHLPSRCRNAGITDVHHHI